MLTGAKTLSGLMGLCVGDALGVPVEFTSRAERVKSPVTTMQGYGTWNQPPGTWSDDSSLSFCLAECLCRGYSLDAIANSFWRWYKEAYWTPRGDVFDIGQTTHTAIMRLKQGVVPHQAGGKVENSNGNGSLMRILPMAYCHRNLTLGELLARVHDVSAITHAHARSQMSCGIYISIAVALLEGADPQTAYLQALQDIQTIYSVREFLLEKPHFGRIFSGEIAKLPVEEINSGGYVIDTLESSLWCLLNSSSYSEAVLKAVNLGGDADTTAAVTGGLAGIYYGVENIPQKWMNQIARRQDIIYLAERFARAVYS
ncbi:MULTISPECIES: ADP-ribosylglycohydrolase family protein [Nostoc]|jgi:ADP-ribosylglycohydrolase|uniref:ADP-ribosylation/Crystallin J1 n=1 Tax=Nostoc punctiforme (strain ATCC 29133 / PCC 73102) TaxID=63737 RepID=B2IT57_NOSP7|nr:MULTISPECIES: ADP-ribosylglycohydrolase family protein [Nostoc]MBD2510891.1 ADP-ribosylglycohydrolase family protein [Desmonostoc muscorum FACHB-395]ACC79555.1 ADP-ribosylation/Crystallin J1 [Nostoc punctiforme PCC 73102]NEU78680.1 ADP-ribosylglycohydrolase family protein [Nostoc sp. UIC 10630]QKQ74398.1 ADP-ribosylglycohydrolase family protein [Nostoc sp. TCL240-02]QLE47186.1 ADP-ribosylglycohydrolase family protein [Nostoc sp. C057]